MCAWKWRGGDGGSPVAATGRGEGRRNRLGSGYWRLGGRLGLVLGWGDAFGVESGRSVGGEGGYPRPPSLVAGPRVRSVGPREVPYLCLTATAQLQGQNSHQLPYLDPQAPALKRGASRPEADRAHALCALVREGPVRALGRAAAGLQLRRGGDGGRGGGERCGGGGHGDRGEGREGDVGRGGARRCGGGRRGEGRGGGEGRVRDEGGVLEAEGDLGDALAVGGQQQLRGGLIAGVPEAQLPSLVGPEDVTPAGQMKGMWGGAGGGRSIGESARQWGGGGGGRRALGGVHGHWVCVQGIWGGLCM